MSVVPGVRGCSAELTAEAVPCKNKEACLPGMQGGLGEWVPCFVCAMTAPLIDVTGRVSLARRAVPPAGCPVWGRGLQQWKNRNAVIICGDRIR